MKTASGFTFGLVLIGLLAASTLAAGIWRYGYVQALEQVAARGKADLALASDRLVTQLSRYRETAVLMADHPVLAALHNADGDRVAADALLLEVRDKTSALMVHYADRAGRVLAAAGGEAGADLQQAAYFRRALNGALGATHGSSAATGQRAYSFAAPSFDHTGRVQGVLIVVVDIENLEQDWRGAWPTVYFNDPDGRVFITNRSEMLGWQQIPGGMDRGVAGLASIDAVKAGGLEIWRQDLSPYIPDRALRLVQPLPVIGLVGESLVDVGPALRLAGLQAAAVGALCMFFGSVLLVVMARRRALASANVVLESRVRDRTRDLEDANTALRREVTEREEAEAALKRAQSDLVQAGKLSALGQMSAGISHELNQPLMAIRQFADNGLAFLDRGQPEVAGENLTRVSQMAARAARIIKNLRAFARNESEPMGKVNLGDVVDQAVELTHARLAADGIALEWQRPGQAIHVLGGEVRLAQVFVNLINNAADAMSGQKGGAGQGRIEIIATGGASPRVEVRDTGPGIADPERIFEPFYSTKEVGESEGMGLGLSISYGLVQSFGGQIRGANAPDGGAIFTVMLEAWRAEAAA